MELVRFMQTSAGRSIRVLLGLILIAAGVVLGGGWLALAIVGLVPSSPDRQVSASSLLSSMLPSVVRIDHE